MSYAGTVTDIAADNTSAAEVKIPPGASRYTIAVYAVDANDNYEAVAAGTADLEIKVSGSSQYEPVYQSDGTTAVTFAVTAAPESVKLEGTSAAYFRTSPTSLTAAKKLRLAVSYG